MTFTTMTSRSMIHSTAMGGTCRHTHDGQRAASEWECPGSPARLQAVIDAHLAKQQGWRSGDRESMMRWRKEAPVRVAGSSFYRLGFLQSSLLRSRRRVVTSARNGATVAAHTSRRSPSRK